MKLTDAHKDEYLIYNRKSTDDADSQRNSLAYQKQRNLEYAERLGLRIAVSLTIPGFCERGVINESHSAYKQDDELFINSDGLVQYRVLRPKFSKLGELLKDKKIKGAIFLCWDRASRNEQDGLILKKLIKLGCDIRFVEATYDNTSAGDLHRDIDGVFAAYYSRSISEKIRNAQRKLRAERRCLYISPIGYLDCGSNSKPFDPERAPIVKRLFELYATELWSFRQLAKWAQAQGLTKKPKRRQRTKEEIAGNVDQGTIPQIARPVDHKTIEYILKNPFYIGKVKVADGRYADSASHEALIDTAIFLKVQAVLKKRRVSVHYVDRPFYGYRGFVRCECGRSYSPYPQKGIIYYRSYCKGGCASRDPNLSESEITRAIRNLLRQAHLTENEHAYAERRAASVLPVLQQQHDKNIADLQAKRRSVADDLAYLAENKVSLIRTGVMTAELLQKEEERLAGKLRNIAEEIQSRAASAPAMLRYVLSFSEAINGVSAYFEHALDSQRREVAAVAFTQLVFRDRQLIDYAARDGFAALLKRARGERQTPRILEPEDEEDPYLHPSTGEVAGLFFPREFLVLEPQNEATLRSSGHFDQSGAGDFLFLELFNLYRAAQRSMEKLDRLPFIAELGRPPANGTH